MSISSERLRPVFEKTKHVCFGRFVIDVPATAKVIWGPVEVPYSVERIEGKSAKDVPRLVADREAKLKAEPRYPRTKGLSLYMETLTGPREGQSLIVSQQDFDTAGMLRVESYLPVGDAAVWLQGGPLEPQRERVQSDLGDVGQRLREMKESDIPSDPGLCLDGLFLPDKAGGQFDVEHIRVGIKLPEFPDLQLSIYVAAKDEVSQDDDPRVLFERANKEAERNGTGSERARFQIFRKAERHLAGLHGYEILAKRPGRATAPSTHEFVFGNVGVPKDAYKPTFDIELHTGVRNNKMDEVKPSLSDDEVVQIWEALLKSIRVRPVQERRADSEAGTETANHILAATGRACPSTGWWECVDGGDVQGGRRQFFKEGERMPHVVLLGKQSIWQKLKGEHPSYKTATVWKLVDYEHPTPAAVPLDATPPSAEAIDDHSPAADTENNGDDAEQSGLDKA